MKLHKVCVIGLGKLGSPMAACFAAKGFDVIGVDVNPANVAAINNGKAPVAETGLQQMIDRGRKHLIAVDSAVKAVLQCDATFILVPTPTDASGGFSLEFVLQAAREVGEALKMKNEYHLVVITSTVMPGATGGAIKDTLESTSGKKCGKDFGLCYNPEFIALGTVIRDFMNPDFILVGESDSRAGKLLEDFYPKVCDNRPTVRRMNFVNAELTKIAVNTFVTTKISFANFLARVCHEMPSADVDVVTSALGSDTRIGAKYLKGGVGYGGPCFPRDNVALSSLAKGLGVKALISEATDHFNKGHVQWLSDTVKANLTHEGAKVAILGLAYKPGTEVIEEAQGIYLAKLLVENGIEVIGFDPAANHAASRALKKGVKFADTLMEAALAADVLVVLGAGAEFQDMDLSKISRSERPRILVDCWRHYKGKSIPTGILYFPLGMGSGNLSNRADRREGKRKAA